MKIDGEHTSESPPLNVQPNAKIEVVLQPNTSDFISSEGVAKATPQIYEPPCSAHKDCQMCEEHYISVAVQKENKQLYVECSSDVAAQGEINGLLHDVRDHLDHVKEVLGTHGDFILSRWRRKSIKWRRNFLQEHAGIYFWELPTPINPASLRKMSFIKNMLRRGVVSLIPWLEREAFAEDPTKMLSLLHMRSQFGPECWAPFDIMQNSNVFEKYQITRRLYNKSGVVMYGPHYGTLTDFDTELAHSWGIVGFPRAHLTIRGQLQIAKMLSEFADTLVGSAPESGMAQWSLSLSGGLSRADNGTNSKTFDDRAFAPPAPFDIASLLAKARNHLDLMLDEVNAMQTSPEYMRKQVLSVFDGMHLETGQTSDEAWRQVTWNVIIGWLNQITRWQDVVAECENLRDNLADSTEGSSPGAPLSVRADAALKAFGIVVSRDLKAMTKDLRYKLCTTKIMQDHVMQANSKDIYWTDLDPTKQGDRLAYISSWLQIESKIEVPRPVSGIACALQMELAGIACDRDVEVFICGIALLDEMRLAW